MLCPKGKPFNHRTRSGFIPAYWLEKAALRFRMSDRHASEWTYDPCETTGEAIFGKGADPEQVV
jgi:hypothetical protein